MDAKPIVVQQLGISHDRLKQCIDDLTDEEARRLLAGALSPVVWQLGHVAVMDASFAQRAGGTHTVPARFTDLFKMGSGGAADYPPLSDVWGAFEASHQALLATAQTADYTKPIEGRAYSNVGEMLTYASAHRTYHIGKMTSLRALLGKKRLFG